MIVPDTVDRIKGLLEAGRCIVHPNGGYDVEIQIAHPNGTGSEIWVKRTNHFHGTSISCPGTRLSLSEKDAKKLKPIIDKLVYEERDKRAWFLLSQLDKLEKGLP